MMTINNYTAKHLLTTALLTLSLTRGYAVHGLNGEGVRESLWPSTATLRPLNSSRSLSLY